MRQKARFEQEVFEGTEELAIKVGDIVHEMRNQVPETLFGLNIFLTTDLAKPALHFGSAI